MTEYGHHIRLLPLWMNKDHLQGMLTAGISWERFKLLASAVCSTESSTRTRSNVPVQPLSKVAQRLSALGDEGQMWL